MALSIKHPEADRLARELANRTGQSLTEAIVTALREKLEREERRQDSSLVHLKIRRIQERLAALPVLDDRSADEIIGYDEHGLPR